MSLVSEKEVLQATLDLACGRAQLETLSYHLIIECYEEILRKYHVARQIQQRCFQLLLLMSAESENHLTWFEKIKKVNYYLSKLPKRKDSPSSSSISPSRSRTSFRSSNSIPTRSLSPSSHNFMTLTDRGRKMTIPPSKVSTLSPSTLHEGSELSMLLNNRNPTDLYQSTGQYSSLFETNKFQSTPTTETPKSILKRYDDPTYSSLQLFSSPQPQFAATTATTATNEITPKRGISFLDEPGSQESLKHIQDRVDTMQEDSVKTRNLIAHLAYRIDKKNLSESSFVFQNPVDSPMLVASMNARTTATSNTTNYQQQPSYATNDGGTPMEYSRNMTMATATPATLNPEDLFSPVSKLNQSHQEHDEHELKYSITTPGLSPPMKDHKKSQEEFAAQLLQEMSSPSGTAMKAAESAENSIAMTRQIRNYSQSLRQSSAMQKYLQSSDTKPGIDNGADDSFLISKPSSRHDYLQSDAISPINRKSTAVVNFATTLEHEEEFVPKKVTKTVLAKMEQQEDSITDSAVTYSMKEDSKERKSNIHPVETVANDSFGGSTSLFRARLLSPNYASIDTLTIEPSYLPYDEANMQFYSSHAVSSMKLFLLFQKWFIHRIQRKPIIPLPPTRLLERPNDSYPPHYISAMFYNHFDCLATDLDLPALSNLFGLEQWLREKVCEFIIHQTKLQLFGIWYRESFGKYAISTQYYSQKKFTSCFENWREYHVRLQLKFKNAILIYFIDQQAAGKKLLNRKDTGKEQQYPLHDDEYYSIKQHNAQSKHDIKIKKRKKLFRTDDDMDGNGGLLSVGNQTAKKAHFVSWKDWYQQVQLYHHLLIYRYHTMILPTQYSLLETNAEEKANAPRALNIRRNTSILPFYHFRILTENTNRIYGKKPYTSNLQKTDFPFAVYQKYSYPAYSTGQYETCLDQVFLYTQFRRFIHRALYLRKAAYINAQYRRKRPLLHIWSIMKTAYLNRKERAEFILQPMMNTLEYTKQRGQVRKAFTKLFKNVSLQRERRVLYGQYRSSLLANKYCLVAVYMFSAPYYVRCFHAWKQNMIASGGLLGKSRRKLQAYYERYHSRKVLMYWKVFRKQKQAKARCFTSLLEWKFCWLMKLYQQALFQQMHSNLSSSSSTLSSSKIRSRNTSGDIMSIEQFDKQLIVYKQLVRRISCHYQHEIAASMDEVEDFIRQQYAIIHCFQGSEVIQSSDELTMKLELCTFHQREVPPISTVDAVPHLDMWMNYLQSYQKHHSISSQSNRLEQDASVWSYHQYRSKLEELYSTLWSHYYNPILQSVGSRTDNPSGSQKRVKEEEINISRKISASGSTKTIAAQQYLQLLQPNGPTTCSTNVTTRHPVYYRRHIPSLLRISMYKWQQRVRLYQHYRAQKSILQQKRLCKWFIAWKEHFQLMHIIQRKQYKHALYLWLVYVRHKKFHSKQQHRFVYHHKLRKALTTWRRNNYSLYRKDFDNPSQHSLYNHLSGLFANHYKFEKLWYFIRQKCTQTTSAMPTTSTIAEKEKGSFLSTTSANNFTTSGNRVVNAFLATTKSGGKGRYNGNGKLEEPVSGSSRHAAASLMTNPHIPVFTRQMLSTLPLDLLAYQQSMNQFILFKSAFPVGNTEVSGGATVHSNLSNQSETHENMMVSSRHLKNYLVTMKGVHQKYATHFRKWICFTNTHRSYNLSRQRFLQFLARRAVYRLLYTRNMRKYIRTCGRKIIKRSLFVWKYAYLFHKRTNQVKRTLLLGWNNHYRRLVYHKVWHRLYGYRIHNLWNHWKQMVAECNRQEALLISRTPQKKLTQHWKEWKTICRIQQCRKQRLRKLAWAQYVYFIQSSQLYQSDYYYANQFAAKKQLFQWKKLVFQNEQQKVLESYGSLRYHYHLLIEGLAAWYKFFAPKWSRKFDLSKRIRLWKSRIIEELNSWKRQQYPYSLIATTASGMYEKQDVGNILSIGGGISGIPPYLLQWKEWKLYQHLKQYELKQFKDSFYRQKKAAKINNGGKTEIVDTTGHKNDQEYEENNKKPNFPNFKMIQNGVLATRLAMKSSTSQEKHHVQTNQHRNSDRSSSSVVSNRNQSRSNNARNDDRYSNLTRQQKLQYSRYEQQQKSLLQMQQQMMNRGNSNRNHNNNSVERFDRMTQDDSKQRNDNSYHSVADNNYKGEATTARNRTNHSRASNMSDNSSMLQRFLNQSPLKSQKEEIFEEEIENRQNNSDEDYDEEEENIIVSETRKSKSSHAKESVRTRSDHSNPDSAKSKASSKARVFTFNEEDIQREQPDQTQRSKASKSTNNHHSQRWQQEAEEFEEKEENYDDETAAETITPMRSGTTRGDLSVTFSPHHKEYIISRSDSSTGKSERNHRKHQQRNLEEEEEDLKLDHALTTTMLTSSASPTKSTTSSRHSSSRMSTMSPTSTQSKQITTQSPSNTPYSVHSAHSFPDNRYNNNIPPSPTMSISSSTTRSSSAMPIKSSLLQQHMRRQSKSPTRQNTIQNATWPGPMPKTSAINNNIIISPGGRNAGQHITPNNLDITGNNGSNMNGGALNLSFSRIRLEDLDLDASGGSFIPSHPVSNSGGGKSPFFSPPGTFDTTLTSVPSPLPTASTHSKAQPNSLSLHPVPTITGNTPHTPNSAGHSIHSQLSMIHSTITPNTNFISPSSRYSSKQPLSLSTPASLTASQPHPPSSSMHPGALQILTQFPPSSNHHPINNTIQSMHHQHQPQHQQAVTPMMLPEHASTPSGYFSLPSLHTLQPASSPHPLANLSSHFTPSSLFSRPSTCAPQSTDPLSMILFKQAWYHWQRYRLHHHYYPTIARQHAYYTISARLLHRFHLYAHTHRIYTSISRRCARWYALRQWSRYVIRQDHLVRMWGYVQQYVLIRQGKVTLRQWYERMKRLVHQRDLCMSKAIKAYRLRSLSMAMIYWKALLYYKWSRTPPRYRPHRTMQQLAKHQQQHKKKSPSAHHKYYHNSVQLKQSDSIYHRAKKSLHFPKRNPHYAHWSEEEEEEEEEEDKAEEVRRQRAVLRGSGESSGKGEWGKTTGESEEGDDHHHGTDEEQTAEEKVLINRQRRRMEIEKAVPTKKLPRENRHPSRPLHRKLTMSPVKYNPSSPLPVATQAASRFANFKK